MVLKSSVAAVSDLERLPGYAECHWRVVVCRCAAPGRIYWERLREFRVALVVSSTSGGLSYETQSDLGLRFVVVRAVVHSEAQQALVLNLGEKKVAQLPPVA